MLQEISFKHDVVTGLTFSFDLSSRSHQMKIKLYGDAYSYGEFNILYWWFKHCATSFFRKGMSQCY